MASDSQIPIRYVNIHKLDELLMDAFYHVGWIKIFQSAILLATRWSRQVIHSLNSAYSAAETGTSQQW